MQPELSIAHRKVGVGHPCFVIAEAGVNHNGCVDRALELIDVAADVGADAVKFQTFKAERLVTRSAEKAAYQKAATTSDETQFEMLRRLELSEDDHQTLQARCRDRGIVFMSTPFDEQCADFLDELDVPVFKLPSGELTNLPFLAHVARKQRPMVVSTGMSSLGEVEQAVDTIRGEGNDQFVLLQCVSNYPADPADANLRALATMHSAFGCLTGYSDHTEGVEVALASVALGASVIEKHFTLDRNLPGPDHQASSEPDEIRRLIEGIRIVESALGTGQKSAAESEANTKEIARKSLVAAIRIDAGTQLTPDLIASKRPGTGLPPAMKSHLLGRQASRDIDEGELLDLEMVA